VARLSWEFQTVTVLRRYRARDHDYVWVSGELELSSGWESILAEQAVNGWELVAACVECSEINNSRTETSGYRLFFKRHAPGSVPV
jgi:hypothetical protein